jgi:hypothetical protein
MAAAGGFPQQALQPLAFVAAADPPEGRAIAAHAFCQRLGTLALGQGQEHPCPFDFKPRPPTTAGKSLQSRQIVVSHGGNMRFASTHGIASDLRYFCIRKS